MTPLPVSAQRNLVTELWHAFDQRNWDSAHKLLHKNLVVHWPHSRERFLGPDNFIAANRAYPGSWRITLTRMHETETGVVTVVKVSDGTLDFYATSFFEFLDEKIVSIEEYWASGEKPPQWRIDGGWAERY